MQKIGFSEAVEKIVARDERYDAEAYAFIRDALDFTLKLRKKNAREEPSHHVSGPELLDGFRQYTLKEFGPMAITVLTYWGIHKGDDVGEIVFNLIREGIFGKSDRDTIDDFRNGFDFREAFVQPYLPPGAGAQQGNKTHHQPAGKTK